MSVLLITLRLWLEGDLDLLNRFNHTSWVAFFTPTGRPKSVSNLCVIEVFGNVFFCKVVRFVIF